MRYFMGTRSLGWLEPAAGFLVGALLVAGCSKPSPTSAPLGTARVSREPLPVSDPVEFLEKCLERYDHQGIKGYRLIMEKQERSGGTLGPREVIEVWFRAHPFSVFMHWLQGARRAENVLYVEGENNDQMLVHPTGLVGEVARVVARDPDGEEARQEGRYSIKQFGLRNTLARTLRDWKAAKEQGTLRVEYRGITRVREVGNRPCYTLRRTQEPDELGVTTVTVYIDTENWFQVGTVEKGADGSLIGEYLYRDIRINPEFAPTQFQPSALTASPTRSES